MTSNGNGSSPSRGTLGADLRTIRAHLPDIPQLVAHLLAAAIDRADRERAQAQIWHGEAAQREAAVARLEVVRAELDRAQRLLPDPDGPGALYAQGGAWVIAQLRAALEPDQAAASAATLNGTP